MYNHSPVCSVDGHAILSEWLGLSTSRKMVTAYEDGNLKGKKRGWKRTSVAFSFGCIFTNVRLCSIHTGNILGCLLTTTHIRYSLLV